MRGPPTEAGRAARFVTPILVGRFCLAGVAGRRGGCPRPVRPRTAPAFVSAREVREHDPVVTIFPIVGGRGGIRPLVRASVCRASKAGWSRAARGWGKTRTAWASSLKSRASSLLAIELTASPGHLKYAIPHRLAVFQRATRCRPSRASRPQCLLALSERMQRGKRGTPRRSCRRSDPRLGSFYSEPMRAHSSVG